MSTIDEEDYLILSEIQHYAFCPRQWALTHIEGQWADNVYTVDGDLMHEKVHGDLSGEKRRDLLIIRGMKVVSHTLGITGICDVVEFHASPDGVSLSGRKGKWRPVPVEYKRGKPKEHDADALQLCAQALCLEEMLACSIPEGYLYYNEIRHRQAVMLTEDLRQRVREGFAQMRALLERGHTPKVKPRPACRSCSLLEVCLPGLNKSPSVSTYMWQLYEEVGP